MSEVTETQPTTEITDLPMPDELSMLKERARMMGIKFSNNIGVDSLKAKIKAHMEADSAPAREPGQDNEPQIPPAIAAEAPSDKPLTRQQIREKLIKDNLKLVRIRVTCLDPKKKDLPGEIFTVANKYIGTVRKYVPFGEVTENGYHVPYCIYQMLKNRKFLHIRTVDKHGKERIVTSYEREFAIEVLPQLTPDELRKLAIQQAATAGQE